MLTRAARRGRTSRLTYLARVSAAGSARMSGAVTGLVSRCSREPGRERACDDLWAGVSFTHGFAAATGAAGVDACAAPDPIAGTLTMARAATVKAARLTSLTRHSLHACSPRSP